MKKAVVTKAHQSNYPNPLKISKGTVVAIERRETEWDGWLWGITQNNQGWIPESYLQVDGERAEFLKDYDATELNVAVGEKLSVLYELNGWHWCEKENGEAGWIPGECLKLE